LIVGVIINLFGFVESSNGVRVTQTSMAILGVAFAYVGVEMILYFISILAVRRLDRKTP
jgi:hypothetical protein